MNKEFSVIKNNMNAIQDFNEVWFMAYGGQAFLTNMIIWNDTYVTKEEKSNIETIENYVEHIKSNLIPRFQKYPDLNFGKFSDRYHSYATDMNICKVLLSKYKVDCDLAMNGFCNGNIELYLKGLIAIYTDLIREFESRRGTKEGLAFILNSSVMKDLYINGRFIVAGMYLDMVQDMLYYMKFIIDKFYKPMITNFFIEIMYEVFLLIFIYAFILKKCKKIFRDYFMIFKLFPAEFFENNLKLTKFFKMNKDADLHY